MGIKSNLVYGMLLALVDQAASCCCCVSSGVVGSPSLKTVPDSNSAMRSTPRMRRHDFSASCTSLKASPRKANVVSGSVVFSDGLACFGAVTDAGCRHQPTLMAGRKPKDVPEFKWINTVLGNLKTSLSGCYHAFDFQKYAARYLAAFCYRFNRRFDLRTLHQRLLIAAVIAIPRPLRLIRVADVHC